MTEHPILFKPELVRAILSGAKTQTRRVMKPQPELAIMPDDVRRARTAAASAGLIPPTESDPRWRWGGCFYEPWPAAIAILGPYGRRGHRLWVREPWARIEPYPSSIGYNDILPVLHYSEWTPELWAYWTRRVIHRATHVGDPPDRWRPSIHMPRWACRLVLPLAEVRVERLQDISEEDAQAEGVEPVPAHGKWVTRPRQGGGHWSARPAFAALWDSAYGKKPGASWDDNPWVWVLRWDPQAILTGDAARREEVPA